jgi:acetolactate synthase-1/2/3 large subunit
LEHLRIAQQFKPAFEHAVSSGRPVVIDVAMMNEPVPTAGHWNINEIYSPDKAVSHVAVAYERYAAKVAGPWR